MMMPYVNMVNPVNHTSLTDPYCESEVCRVATKPPPMAPAIRRTNPKTTSQNTGTDNPSSFVLSGGLVVSGKHRHLCLPLGTHV